MGTPYTVILDSVRMYIGVCYLLHVQREVSIMYHAAIQTSNSGII